MVVYLKCKSKGKAKEQPIITEENDAYAMVQNTSQTQDNTMELPIVTEGNTAYGMVQNTSQDNAMEQPIVTEGNTAYGMVGSPDQPVASFAQQHAAAAAKQ